MNREMLEELIETRRAVRVTISEKRAPGFPGRREVRREGIVTAIGDDCTCFAMAKTDGRQFPYPWIRCSEVRALETI